MQGGVPTFDLRSLSDEESLAQVQCPLAGRPSPGVAAGGGPDVVGFSQAGQARLEFSHTHTHGLPFNPCYCGNTGQVFT